MPPPSANKAAGDITRSSKQGYQWPSKFSKNKCKKRTKCVSLLEGDLSWSRSYLHTLLDPPPGGWCCVPAAVEFYLQWDHWCLHRPRWRLNTGCLQGAGGAGGASGSNRWLFSRNNCNNCIHIKKIIILPILNNDKICQYWYKQAQPGQFSQN